MCATRGSCWLVVIAAINSVIGVLLLSARDHRDVLLGAFEGVYAHGCCTFAYRCAWHRRCGNALSRTTPRVGPYDGEERSGFALTPLAFFRRGQIILQLFHYCRSYRQ